MKQLRKWLHLERERRDLILQAFLLLTLSRLALRLVALKTTHRLVRWMAKRIATTKGDKGSDKRQIAWAIGVVGKGPLGGGTCLAQALVAQQMLCCRGYAARVHVGVAKRVDGRLLAHAWVESDGTVIVGGTAAELGRYSRLPSIDEVFS